MPHLIGDVAEGFWKKSLLSRYLDLSMEKNTITFFYRKTICLFNLAVASLSKTSGEKKVP
jgi:hypothetical protein